VPREISGHAAVRNHARRLGCSTSDILLDKSYHFAAMKGLSDTHKRGRPDIVHFALMEALSTPLFLMNELRVYVYAINDKIIAIADNLRIPKSYARFEGLMVSLFRNRMIKSDEGAVLMELSDGTFEELLDSIGAEKVIGLSSSGVRSTAEKVAGFVRNTENCAFVVGAFPSGRFAQRIAEHLGPVYSIADSGLESHVVIARLIYECEKILLEKGVDHEGDKQSSEVGA